MRISDWSSDVCSSDLLGRGDIDMGFEPDVAPAAGGGETLGLDGQQGVFVVAGEEGGDLDDFAYQFAHKTGLLAKMGGTLLPAPPASLTGACDRDRKSTRLNSSH